MSKTRNYCKANEHIFAGGNTCICGLKNLTTTSSTTVPTAVRITQDIRYDILDPMFLEMLAKIADYGAKKYGDFNWHKSRLEGDKSTINHIYKHLKSYRVNEPYDHTELGLGKEWHLASIAFNAMMEFYYAITFDKQTDSTT